MGNREKGRSAGRPKRSVRHVLASVLLALVILITAGAVCFLALQVSGRNRLYSRADSSELVSTLAGMAVELEEGTPGEETGGWQEGDIRYNGVHYRYNADILTFLFLGIDKMEEVEESGEGLGGGQSDAVFLLVLNPHTREISVIGIPRDTMTEIEIYGTGGNYLGTSTAQLTLQHAYGDGAKVSCERSRDAVTRLFYGLPIHGYCAVNMGAIPLINDAVGGIELEALETLDFKEFHVKEGEHIRLEGMDAYYYLHNRDVTSFNSAGRRLERQKQYLSAYADAVVAALKKDITFPAYLYGTLSRYMVTDISLDEVGYLATQVAGYHFSGEGMRSLKGETVMGEEYEEFYVDEEALYRLLLEVFYEEVE